MTGPQRPSEVHCCSFCHRTVQCYQPDSGRQHISSSGGIPQLSRLRGHRARREYLAALGVRTRRLHQPARHVSARIVMPQPLPVRLLIHVCQARLSSYHVSYLAPTRIPAPSVLCPVGPHRRSTGTVGASTQEVCATIFSWELRISAGACAAAKSKKSVFAGFFQGGFLPLSPLR